jgi:hypothetical protein
MACPRVCLSILFLVLSAVAEALVQHGVTSGGRLVNFTADEDAQNLAKKTAEELKGLLDDVRYDAATKELIGDKEYGESSCNVNRFEELKRGGIVREIESRVHRALGTSGHARMSKCPRRQLALLRYPR